MATLEERFLASYPVLQRLGRVNSEGVPNERSFIADISPDQSRIIGEACFGSLWTRPALSIEQRSLITMSIITVLRRDDNLKGHILSGLDVGFSAEQIVEIMLQLIFYTGAPIANTALGIAKDVFEERGLQVNPYVVFDTNEDPEELYRRGLEMRQKVLGDEATAAFGNDETDQAWERYLLEYVWGSVWTRSGLDLQSRCICVLTALTHVGTEDEIRTYVGAALRLGLSKEQIREIFFHLTFYIGVSQARKAKALAEEVFSAAL